MRFSIRSSKSPGSFIRTESISLSLPIMSVAKCTPKTFRAAKISMQLQGRVLVFVIGLCELDNDCAPCKAFKSEIGG
jgi:hypothetical protein